LVRILGRGGWKLSAHHQVGGEIRGLAFAFDKRQIIAATDDGMVEVMQACPLCRSATDLERLAGDVLKYASDMGLYEQ